MRHEPAKPSLSDLNVVARLHVDGLVDSEPGGGNFGASSHLQGTRVELQEAREFRCRKRRAVGVVVDVVLVDGMEAKPGATVGPLDQQGLAVGGDGQLLKPILSLQSAEG